MWIKNNALVRKGRVQLRFSTDTNLTSPKNKRGNKILITTEIHSQMVAARNTIHKYDAYEDMWWYFCKAYTSSAVF
jgi:hypothetical protein